MKYSDRLEIVNHHLSALLEELEKLKSSSINEFGSIPDWVWPLERRVMDAAEFSTRRNVA